MRGLRCSPAPVRRKTSMLAAPQRLHRAVAPAPFGGADCSDRSQKRTFVKALVYNAIGMARCRDNAAETNRKRIDHGQTEEAIKSTREKGSGHTT
jgi:hypothetical protein